MWYGGKVLWWLGGVCLIKLNNIDPRDFSLSLDPTAYESEVLIKENDQRFSGNPYDHLYALHMKQYKTLKGNVWIFALLNKS